MFHIIKKAPLELVVQHAVEPVNNFIRFWEKREVEVANAAAVAWLRAFAAQAAFCDPRPDSRELEPELWLALALRRPGGTNADHARLDLWTSVARELLKRGLRGAIYDDVEVEHIAGRYYWYLIGRGVFERSKRDEGYLFQNAAIDLLTLLMDDGHVGWTRAPSPGWLPPPH